MFDYRTGGFTLPGEAGYEDLTLKMAEKWGADVIRDSDGTKLSPRIASSGYRIYSTICIIRQHNAFAEKHPGAQQQSFLCSDSVPSVGETLQIRPLDGFFDEQFSLNDTPAAMKYWQVWDRTSGRLLDPSEWEYTDGTVLLRGCVPFHRYSVSFLAWRIWEEINMYNHTTNHWTSEHLRQLDPRDPEAWEYLKNWLRDWCENNPETDVVRLTSLFYNIVWIFGSDLKRRTRFVDWASYDFTVSPAALEAFEKEYGYALTAEDFINRGRLQATHRPPTPHKRDYMDFIQRFVAEKARELVDIIHAYGKEAYVFYDDSWVGMEPYGKYFSSVGFDGLIKCVFSGFECRLCAGAQVPVHELRFHPYLFPVGLGGAPTFMEGGHPEKDAVDYWLHVRRALARQCVDRIGLGGYLHLTVGQDAFNDAIEDMAVTFRRFKALQAKGAPAELPVTVAVLHAWGALRSWTLSGHFHETDHNPLIHINEALSGLPVKVKFISFEDVSSGALNDTDVLISAGFEGDAWSGGDAWRSPEVVTEVTRFVYEGGSFIGVCEPTAVPGGDTRFALAHVLGVDADRGEYACRMPWAFDTEKDAAFMIADEALGTTAGIRVTGPHTRVLRAEGSTPTLTEHAFGKGKAVYMGGFTYSPRAARMLLEMLISLTKVDGAAAGLTDDPLTECAVYPAAGSIVVMNNAPEAKDVTVSLPNGKVSAYLEGYGTVFLPLP
ncbi:MAG: 1,3-beta-galactosyl-N-acetylhexosamine phosphorylase [Clostridia bacterium]|nr:1,3-beta-galactosyl-N-acetylhexosamine phosphorylase [Clostridia bacterium]